MAEAVVSFVVERVGDLLIQEAISLRRVRGQVEEMHSELKHMMNFLKDADKRQHEEERVKGWISEIREVAYDVEDVIETFALEVTARSQPGFRNKCKRYASIFSEAAKRHKVGSEIADLKTRITNLTGSLERYGIRIKDEGEASSSNVSRRQRELRRTYSHVVEEYTVGLETNTENLVRQLVAEEKKGEVVSICGMGGLGKTTLANKVYHHDEVRRHFDGFAWACLSQQFQPRDIWEGILIKLVTPSKDRRDEISKMRPVEIAKELYQFQQQKKCLVILDDIWSVEAWDTLKPAFPTGNASNSKIVLTTRIKTVALHVNPRGILEPQCLTAEESWELLRKKAFSRNDCKDDKEKEDLGRKMVERCAGLPLAINVLGGLLQTKDSVDEWRSVHENIDLYLRRGNRHEQGLSRVHGILALSYHELPYELKPCFLYLCHFQEDQEIRTKNLFRLWVAEGFISQMQYEVKTKETMEDVAESHMHELINRSMVQVGEKGRSGRVKTCRMHDLMRDLCLSEADKESFFKIVVYDGNRQVVSPGVRRLAVYTDQHFEYLRDFELTPKLRSFFLISKLGFAEPLSSRINCFKMLRTLTLTQCRFKDGKCNEIGFVIHLRYLTIIKCGRISLPSSIGNLRYLQTLYIKGSSITIPNEIRKLEQLRHLVLPFYIEKKCWKLIQLGNLGNLQTLQGFDTKVFDMKELVKLTNLKKLGIRNYNKEDLRVFEPQRIRFNSLISLALRMSFDSSVIIEETDLEHVFTCCHHLCKLGLEGKLRKLPEHQHFPPNLTKLTLYGTELKEDPMATLEKLPKLEYLYMYRVSDAREIVCSSKGFPQLKTLILSHFTTYCVVDTLEWRVEEEAVPNLCHLHIHYCRNLKMIPDGLRFITTLRELVIRRMPPEFYKRLQVVNGQAGEDVYKVQHVPSIIIRDTWLD